VPVRYRYFEIENFKGIRKTRLDLPHGNGGPRVYTLVGLNESGKTTVLEAIDRFQAVEEGEISPKQLSGWTPPDPASLVPIAERSNFNGTIVIRAGVELDDDDVDAARQLVHAQGAGFRLKDLQRSIVIQDSYKYVDSQFVSRTSSWTNLRGTGLTKAGRTQRSFGHGSHQEVWQKLAAFYRKRLPPIWYFPDFLFDFPEKIYLEEREDETPSNRFFRALVQDVLDALDRDLRLDVHIVDRYRSGEVSARDNVEQVLLQAARHVSHTVVSEWNKIFAERRLSGKRVTMELGEDPATAPNPGSVWVRFRIEDTDGVFAVRDRSLGFRWFFVYLMLTTYRGRRSTSEDMLFLFDEPASNLHPSAQSALLASLRELAQRASIIYTTHSHHLIEPSWLAQTYVVRNASLDPAEISTDFTADRTDILVTSYNRFAAEHPAQSQYFQPILDVLDYAPSKLEMVPEIVMVEGKSDYYLLRYAAEVLKLGPHLALLPGGGAGTLDTPIQLYVAWGRAFVILLDSDKAGKAQVARYEKKFGPLVAQRLISLAEAAAAPEVKAIESLLSEEDKLAIQNVIDEDATTFDKKRFALGVQHALGARTPIQLSDEGQQVLRSVLSALKTRLQDVANP
jgi:hypothetical protein